MHKQKHFYIKTENNSKKALHIAHALQATAFKNIIAIIIADIFNILSYSPSFVRDHILLVFFILCFCFEFRIFYFVRLFIIIIFQPI